MNKNLVNCFFFFLCCILTSACAWLRAIPAGSGVIERHAQNSVSVSPSVAFLRQTDTFNSRPVSHFFPRLMLVFFFFYVVDVEKRVNHHTSSDDKLFFVDTLCSKTARNLSHPMPFPSKF